MSFLRIWLIASGIAIAAALLWAFAPILIPIILLTGGLGGIAAAVVAAARRIEHYKGADLPIDLSRDKSWRDRTVDGYHQRPEQPD